MEAAVATGTILCLGHVAAFHPRPMLEEQNWAHRCDLRTVVADCWGDSASAGMNPPARG
jgi:hypothetical protein